jgi:polyisoprenoid-binding protein YceI
VHARVYVFTFKEGLLSRLAHDLRISVTRFELRIEQGRVDARFDASSLRVDGVARRERVDATGLSADDKAKIEATIRNDILHAARHPEVRVTGALRRTDGSLTVDAELHLHGHSQELRLPVRSEPQRTFVEVELKPSKFGIPPYKAVAGAIRLQDRIVIRVEFPEELAKLEAIASSGEGVVFGPA